MSLYDGQLRVLDATYEQVLTDKVIKAKQGSTELWNASVTGWSRCLAGLLAFVAFHDDPDLRADTSINQLQWK